MNKMIKKLTAGAMAAAVVLGGVAASPVSVKAADSYSATIGFTDSSWTYQNWEKSVEITGDGTYTLTVEAADVSGTVEVNESNPVPDAYVFVIDVVGINLDDDGNILENAVTLDDVHVYADGTEISVDTSKVLTGDIEEKGNFRIEIYNEYGDTKADSPIDTALSWSESLEITFTISNTGIGSTEETSEEDTTSEEASEEDTTSEETTSEETTSEEDDSTKTGDVTPIAAVVVLLAGCGVIFVAAKKRTA